MFKIAFLFSLLWYLTGNPIVAVIIILAILYFIDRRFIGITPSILKPITRNRRLSNYIQELRLNPHNTSDKLNAARILIEKKRYNSALQYLQEILKVMGDSADVLYETGFCYLQLGQKEKGEQLILQALEVNPRVKYGEGYLKLGEAFANVDERKALHYLEQFREVNSSSCEAYYRLGQLYNRLGRQKQGKEAFREATVIYRGLPKYMKRKERKWALLAGLRA